MKYEMYELIERYMMSVLCDKVHDAEHVYRVLNMALDIASREEEDVDTDVLVTSCLLHDIGRERRQQEPGVSHADIGGDMAYEWLLQNGFSGIFAAHVRDCVRAHSFRGNINEYDSAKTIEARILYDADKLDAVGAIGIARTLAYGGLENEPLFIRDAEGNISDGEGPSFLYEYRFKLSKLYDGLYTNRGREIGMARKKAAEDFIRAFWNELAFEKGITV